MARGARSKFGAPIFEREVFRKQMYCFEESTCDIAGTFRPPLQWFCARESCSSCPPRYAPAGGLQVFFLVPLADYVETGSVLDILIQLRRKLLRKAQIIVTILLGNLPASSSIDKAINFRTFTPKIWLFFGFKVLFTPARLASQS